MTRQRSKSVNFDTMVKFFLKRYKIPTKRDIERLESRLERMEALMDQTNKAEGKKKYIDRGGRHSAEDTTASDIVVNVIKQFKDGVGFKEIHDKTGFDPKKLRNIIFRLNDIGKIKRIRRGLYVAVED